MTPVSRSVHFRTDDPPEVVIERSRGSVIAQLGEVWLYRELLFFLSWRDIKVRYRQTLLGAAWAVLQPVLTMVLFTVIFGHYAHLPSDGVPYAVFSYAGLLAWMLFSSAVGQASNSVVANPSLVSKIYFPRLILPIAATFPAVVDFAVAFVVYLGLMLVFGVVPTIRILALPLFVLLCELVSLSIGIWLSAINVRFRDVRYAVPFLLQIWLYATPVVYPLSFVNGIFRALVALNPMTGVVEGFRWCLLGRPAIDIRELALSALVSLVVLVSGVHFFRQAQRAFADIM